MIVRDEERVLGDCLRSLQGVVDEIVVVDTGSRDSSREIAAAHGARLAEFAWCNDFAAARNYALDQATGHWILYIDADERVRPCDRTALERRLSTPDWLACTVQFHPRTGYTAYPEHRLFRRDPRIRFKGAMHETIIPALHALTAAGAGVIGASDLTIDHIGYDGDQSHKLARNLRHLQIEIRDNPNRVYLWWHLGCVYRDLGRLADAESAWIKGIELARARTSRHPDEGMCFVDLAKLMQDRGGDAMALIEEGLALQPRNWLLHWLKANALMTDCRYGEAMPILKNLASVDGAALVDDIAYDQKIFGVTAMAGLGACAFRLGRYAESEDWYRRAEALAPESLELRTKRQLAALRTASG